jgi:hypothetical protein
MMMIQAGTISRGRPSHFPAGCSTLHQPLHQPWPFKTRLQHKKVCQLNYFLATPAILLSHDNIFAQFCLDTTALFVLKAGFERAWLKWIIPDEKERPARK